MRSYSSYVGGEDVPGSEWVYCLRASALLADVLPGLALKRDLEKGRRHDGDSHEIVEARCAIADDEVSQRALEAARAAAPVWGATPLDVRFRVIERFHEELWRRREEFVSVIVAEGHPRTLAEWEVASLLRCSDGPTTAWCRQQMGWDFVEGDRQLRLVRKPDGVVVLSPPLNAAAISSLSGVAVLAAGNALVVKAPRSSPYGVMWALRELLVPVLDEVGAPPGVLNVLCGHPTQMIDQWMESPLVDDIMFFGSSEVGIPLGVEAVRRGKKPILELAGNDGCVVWRDADIDSAAEALTECFFGSGQICMVPNYVVAHPAIADALIDRLVSLAGKVRPGYPEDPEVLLSPVYKTEKYFAYLSEAMEMGAELLTGGRRLEVDGEPSETGIFIEPTVLRVNGLARAREMSAVAKETFFPLLPVVVAEDVPDDQLLGDVIGFVNANPYGLRNSLWAQSPDVIEQFVTRVTNGGILKVNDSHVALPPYLAPNGGGGLTGGPFGELNYPMLRTSHLQGISIGTGIQPRRAVVEAYAAREATR
ncbi:aldehyde dehydrogenase family protein [Phytohabitans rumicis]|uniref:aldehyde dehydrogenase family protein n=1 Tax=Phytohabitans rumicis TaxID=1076125 RepID=UPI001FE811C4|nr:aldehyde dehydrogenase [Phytohabitans rumicis]